MQNAVDPGDKQKEHWKGETEFFLIINKNSFATSVYIEKGGWGRGASEEYLL